VECLAVVAALFIGRDPVRIAAPFGPAHDGFDAALYMTGGRVLLEYGPIIARFGASARTIAGHRVVHAHHPPLV
jgi:hypothetical protein